MTEAIETFGAGSFVMGDRSAPTSRAEAAGSAGGSSSSYLVREEDGSSKLTLEEGTFFLLTEESA